ncbi:MAG: tRNA uridine-5-carboxymethylaminomethyl(34) synthesis GTPase MnmE [Clostridia bacterium]|nr:tRNA uridine-5-carboxymethylaminomethyl(34) synthesis GTPase MnmE [Clostridia bacterium]
MEMSNSTVAAVSTPNAPGGIGIIRISGEDALAVAGRVFFPVSGETLADSRGYRAYFGDVIYNGSKIDEAVCLVYRAPHSYTGEDTAEINCHGGLFVTKQVLRAVLDAGAQPAGPGEFTKRAFLNGKMDLASSESVMNLIGASGKQAAAAALNTLEGNLSRKIRACCDRIIGVCASLAAWVDYPDEDIEEIGNGEMLSVFESVRAELKEIINRFDCGRALTEGVDTVIVGKPNVGKSAIMNLLTGFQRSIVTDIAGTTRDVVEEKITVGDIILRIADTAGIRETENTVENIGVSLARKRLDRAELVLAVFDGSSPVSDEDREIIKECGDRKKIALLNKSDLPRRADIDEIEKSFDRTVVLSAMTGEGIDELEKAISEVLMTDEFDPSAACLAGERQRACCVKAIGHLDGCIDALNSGMTPDAVNVCADCAVDALLELTGEKATAAVVDEVFSRFCVGK